MNYLTDKDPDQPDEEHIRELRDYLAYLDSIADVLPPGARDYAMAPWHYVPADPRCPHGARIETLTIAKATDAETHELEIDLRLRAARQRGDIELHYDGVRRYSMDGAQSRTGDNGDWLVDEIALTPDGTVAHTIELTNGMIRIECRELRYTWLPAPEAEDEGENKIGNKTEVP